MISLVLALMAAAPPAVAAPAPLPVRATATNKRAAKRKVRRRARAVPRIAAVPAPVRAAVASVNAPNCELTPLALGCRGREAAHYRIAPEAGMPDMKMRSLRETGRTCGLVGEQICKSKPFPVLTTADQPLPEKVTEADAQPRAD